MSLESAVYTITNVYTSQPATLSSANDGTAVQAVALGANDDTKKGQWTVTNGGNGQYTIKSYAYTTSFAHAGDPVQVGAEVSGRKVSQSLDIQPTGNADQYTIGVVGTQLYWGVSDRSTFVTLRNGTGDARNQWTLVKV